jgi:ferredoxin-NADP reductase
MRSFILAILPLLVSSFAPARFVRGPFVLYNGPPQYDKIDGLLRKAEVLAEGSVLLHVEHSDSNIDYKPGHVFALEIPDPDDPSKEWMRGPYTISRATETSFDVLVKVVGKKTETFAAAGHNTPVRFGGKFHVPILDGIDKGAKRVVFISTGTGVGPCIGAVEGALQDKTFPPIELFAAYRTAGEICNTDYLNELAASNPLQFKWSAILSSEKGRISNNENLQAVVAGGVALGLGLGDSHFHLIGNAQMVKEWQAGLQKAGVPGDKVTVESYFNHKAPIDEKAVERIAAAVSASCSQLV